jgi:hypothetical protein
MFRNYLINTLICGLFFAPIIIYVYFRDGRLLTEDDIIAFFMFGWILGAMLKNLAKAFIITSEDALDTIKNKKE